MEEKKGIKLCLALSGRGSDAASILVAHKKGEVPEVEKIILLYTVKGSGEYLEQFELAKKLIEYVSITRSIKSIEAKRREFGSEVSKFLIEQHINLLFGVGCKHFLPTVENIDGYNIHPADIDEHGGNRMYGLAVHKHVLESVLDKIDRGRGNIQTQFFTKIVIHKITKEFDAVGTGFQQQKIPIPKEIIKNLYQGEITLEEAAEDLQKYVIRFEHILLPQAVRSAAQIILDRKNGREV